MGALRCKANTDSVGREVLVLVEAVLNSETRDHTILASESKHEGQRGEAAGPSQLETTHWKLGHRLVLVQIQHGPHASLCRRRQRSR